jgi:cytidylate kinase
MLTQIVAIDGPAGAGKSAVAQRAAKALGMAFLDTGAMYRAATWRALHHHIDLDDAQALAASTTAMDLELRKDGERLRVFVDGQEVTEDIRSQEVTRLIYKLDQNPAVRAHLVQLQREFAVDRPTVAEGRDMGSVVFPSARCKIYMEASLDERTQRRRRDLEAKGIAVDFEELKAEIHDRDEKTKNREVAPLRRAEDAIYLDTTELTLEQVVDRVVTLARQSLG